MRYTTLQYDAMRCDGTSVDVDQGEAAGGGQRGGVLAGVWAGRGRLTGLDEGAGLLRCGGKVWMIWQTAAASRLRLRIRRISPSSPSARPCSGPYSRIANVGSAELGTMIQSGDVKACSAQEVTTATTRGPNPHLARPVFAANCCGLCRREQHQQHRHSARPRSLHHS
jgi:hypothetical protein